jgi:hypothetical protein
MYPWKDEAKEQFPQLTLEPTTAAASVRFICGECLLEPAVDPTEEPADAIAREPTPARSKSYCRMPDIRAFL